MNRRDFGSFHASNVEELISLSEEEYRAPDSPIKLPTFTEFQNEEVKFGKEMKQKHFLLGDDYTFINHGAFGAVIKDVLLVAQKWQLYVDTQPVKFFDRELLPQLVYVTRRMAKFIGCDPADLVLVPNVTTAVNSILQSFPLSSGDEVMLFSTEYGAVKKAIREICVTKGATIHELNIKLPVINKHEIIDSVAAGLHDNTKLLVVDHIPSNTPFIMPIKEIVDKCHARNIKVLVDGAHALGQIELDVNRLGADFYATNCHKWFGACKGSALLYVAKPYHDVIMPLVISHGYQSGFVSKFIWTGMRDYSPLLALHTALDFWISLNPSNIRDYTHTLAKQAGDMLVRAWETQLLAPPDMTGSMLCVQLPEVLYKHLDQVSYSEAEAIQNILYHRFNIEVPIKVINNVLYVRISAHIYNTMEDYKHLAESVIKLKTEEGLLETASV